MKIRSKALWQYLTDTGALNGTKDDIAIAKRAYRNEYKRKWQRRQERKKELRPSFTLKEYRQIMVKALDAGLTPTAYTRAVILAWLNGKDVIPHRYKLQKVLQLLGMAIMTASDFTTQQSLLAEAEKLLLEYLKEGV